MYLFYTRETILQTIANHGVIRRIKVPSSVVAMQIVGSFRSVETDGGALLLAGGPLCQLATENACKRAACMRDFTDIAIR